MVILPRPPKKNNASPNFLKLHCFLSPGATDSVTKYLQLSQAAEARANASTIDTGSLVETSAALRHLTEDKLNQTTEEFLKRHSEHAQKLDSLAGELQTLDLSVISHKVGSLNHVFAKPYPHCVPTDCHFILVGYKMNQFAHVH